MSSQSIPFNSCQQVKFFDKQGVLHNPAEVWFQPKVGDRVKMWPAGKQGLYVAMLSGYPYYSNNLVDWTRASGSFSGYYYVLAGKNAVMSFKNGYYISSTDGKNWSQYTHKDSIRGNFSYVSGIYHPILDKFYIGVSCYYSNKYYYYVREFSGTGTFIRNVWSGTSGAYQVANTIRCVFYIPGTNYVGIQHTTKASSGSSVTYRSISADCSVTTTPSWAGPSITYSYGSDRAATFVFDDTQFIQMVSHNSSGSSVYRDYYLYRNDFSIVEQTSQSSTSGSYTISENIKKFSNGDIYRILNNTLQKYNSGKILNGTYYNVHASYGMLEGFNGEVIGWYSKNLYVDGTIVTQLPYNAPYLDSIAKFG